jgi:hypothetical protein
MLFFIVAFKTMSSLSDFAVLIGFAAVLSAVGIVLS